MANPEHVEIVGQGADAIRAWRQDNPGVRLELARADLRGLDLRRACLDRAKLWKAGLRGADLREAHLNGAYLRSANLRAARLDRAELRGATLAKGRLSRATLCGADLTGADLREANLSNACLWDADLTGAGLEAALLHGTDLCRAKLHGATLERAILVEARVQSAVLAGCRVYGVSAWNLTGEPASQAGLVVTRQDDAPVTVDNLKVAQFIYLLLHNPEIRDVIDTVASKVVLILGRFSQAREPILDAIRDDLRKRNLAPVVFNFVKPPSKTTGETIMILARMARFVIADVTDAKSVLQELAMIVPCCTSLPVQPILLASQVEPGMWDTLTPYPWFLRVHRYESEEQLLTQLPQVIRPADEMAEELRQA